MQTNNLVRKTKNKKVKLIGRGGKRGKTSGRGTKGQWAHGGHGIRPQMRDIIKKFPKLRGHGKNRSRTVNSDKREVIALNLGAIDEVFKAGEKVTVETMLEKGIVKKSQGRIPRVKILAGGEVSKKLSFIGFPVSKEAKSKIEKAGGSIK